MTKRQETIELPEPVGILSEEAEALRITPPPDIIEYIETHRRLTDKETARPGRWNWDFVPYMIEPTRAITWRGIEQETIQGCTQFGKTELFKNWLFYCIAGRPAPFLFLMPTEAAARERITAKLAPMLAAHDILQAELEGVSLNAGSETHFRRMILYPAWALSSVTVADRYAESLFVDETKELEAAIGNQSDAITQLRNRAKTARNGHLAVTSSPTDGHSLLHREIVDSDQRRPWWPCPHCCAYHIPSQDHMHLDKTDDGALLPWQEYQDPARSFYACPHCATVWTEADRHAATLRMIWAPGGCEIHAPARAKFDKLPTARAAALWTHDPEARQTLAAAGIRIVNEPARPAIHTGRYISSFLVNPEITTIATLAKKWARAQELKKRGDINALKTYVCDELAEEWDESDAGTAEEALLQRRDLYKAGTVPDGVQLITIGVDIQQDHMYATAWGWGHAYECWLIEAQRIETGDTKQLDNWREFLTPFLAKTWPTTDGQDMACRLSLIDYGHNPQVGVVYVADLPVNIRAGLVRGEDWTANLTRRSPIGPQATKQLRKHTRAHAPNLWTISAGDFKNRWVAMAEIEQGHGSIHLPADVTEDFIRQFCSEHRRLLRGRKRRHTHEWVPRTTHRPNHYWDCSVYAQAAAELIGVMNLRPPEETTNRSPLMERRFTPFTNGTH